MTLLEYRIFHTVIKEGSYARAAQVLHLTPSAISHAISSMEKSCGFPLFVRGRSGVALTHNGETLVPVIRQVLSAEESVEQMVDEFRGVQRGRVRLGCFNSVCMAWMPEIVREYRQHFPGVEIEIHQGTYDDVSRWIKTGVVDIGFLSTQSATDLQVFPLYRDRMMCVVPRGFKTENASFITLDEIKGENFIVQGDAVGADVQAYLNRHHVGVRASCRVMDDLSAMAMVESGFGICIMPALLLEKYSGALDVYPLEPLEYREFGITALSPESLAPAVRQMARLIERFAAGRRREDPLSNEGLNPSPVF